MPIHGCRRGEKGIGRYLQQSPISRIAFGVRVSIRGFGAGFLSLSGRCRYFRLDAISDSAERYQATLTDLIQEGLRARHVRRMRMLSMERRGVLVRAVKAEMGKMLNGIGTEAGTHHVALLPRGLDDSTIARKAAERGLLCPYRAVA
jgi:hypothetical protein